MSGTTVKPTVKPTERPTEKITEKPTQKPTQKPTEEPTEEPSVPWHRSFEGERKPGFNGSGENWDQKPRRPPIQHPIGSSAGRLSVLSSEIKIITTCVVVIASLLLICARTG